MELDVHIIHVYGRRSQRTEFSLEDPFGLLAGSDRIRGNGRSKSYLRSYLLAPPHLSSSLSSSSFLLSLRLCAPLSPSVNSFPSHLLISFFVFTFFFPRPFHLPFLSPPTLVIFGVPSIRSPLVFTRSFHISSSARCSSVPFLYILMLLRVLLLPLSSLKHFSFRLSPLVIVHTLRRIIDNNCFIRVLLPTGFETRDKNGTNRGIKCL